MDPEESTEEEEEEEEEEECSDEAGEAEAAEDEEEEEGDEEADEEPRITLDPRFEKVAWLALRSFSTVAEPTTTTSSSSPKSPLSADPMVTLGIATPEMLGRLGSGGTVARGIVVSVEEAFFRGDATVIGNVRIDPVLAAASAAAARGAAMAGAPKSSSGSTGPGFDRAKPMSGK